MAQLSTLGARRLGFGTYAADNIPTNISEAKSHFLKQLHGETAFEAPELMTSQEAMQMFISRARVIKSGGTKEDVSNFPTQAEVESADLNNRLKRIIVTKSPFLERLSLYWLSHFTSSDVSSSFSYFSSSIETEAIRPNMLGAFSNLLTSVSTHPQMLFYLNNRSSIGPGSQRAARAPAPKRFGINENHAREILELHSMGIDGGYHQQDIIELAKAMTGWSIDTRRQDIPIEARMTFNSKIHEPGTRAVLGKAYPDTGANQAISIFRDLAHHPATARHVSRRMIKHFIGNPIPQPLEDEMTAAFIASEGDLMKVTSTLIEHQTTWTAPLTKLRTPLEFMAATGRLLGWIPSPPKALNALAAMGQPYMMPGGPNGWPEENDTWAAPDTWKSRLDWAAQMSAHAPVADLDPTQLIHNAFGNDVSPETRAAVIGGATSNQSLTLMLLSPEFQRR